MNACIKHGFDKKVCNPYGGHPSGTFPSSSTDVELVYPEEGWLPITEAFSTAAEVPQFNTGHIVAYFVTRTVTDSLPAADFKSVNKSAEGLFRCGHVQAIQVCSTDKCLFVKAKCIPEMRNDRVYFVQMTLSMDSFDVMNAQCGCPAGRGPHGSCKHIAALSYALADFCRLGMVPEFLTCTDKLQQWNRPRGRHVDPIPVEQLGTRRRDLMPTKERALGSQMIFDPRPLCLRGANPVALETLRCDLLSLGQPSGLLSVIVPCTEKIDHDHCYCSNDQQGKVCNTDVPSDSISQYINVDGNSCSESEVLNSISLTVQQRFELEEQTRSQASSTEWFEARRHRITGSKCGRILTQKEKTTALLQFCIYPKPMKVLPKPVAWGRNNEEKARQCYVKYMNSHGHSGLETRKCGFVVHREKGWLGASPDAWVTDPSVTSQNGIAEFKCPFTKAGVHPEEACADKDFYCSVVEGKVQLKRGHSYYHQVQLQLFVADDLCEWCDFCVFTNCGVVVERIYPDTSWQQTNIPRLQCYWYEHILPELVDPKHKPSYYL